MRKRSTDGIKNAGTGHVTCFLYLICELCFCLLDEMEDITYSRSMCIIIDALMDTVMEYFHITETQLEKFTASFIKCLPKYMQEALERKGSAA